MSSEALYERYKDALKRGHVASLRGRVDEALLAYAEAAGIAPERPTPHSSAGTALLRRKRPVEALRHYEVALSIAPRDEAGLLGRAQSLAAMDRRGEAADAFDTLAEVQAGIGRLADAVDTARRGLELAEGRERRRTLERLISRLRASEPDEPGRLALERALQVLEGPAVPQAKPGHKTPAGAIRAGVAQESAGEDAAQREEPEPVWLIGAEATAEADGAAAPADEAAAGELTGIEPDVAPFGAAEGVASDAAEAGEPDRHEPATAAPDRHEPPEAAPVPVPSGPFGRTIPLDLSSAEMAARAEAAADTGEPGAAIEAMLDLAALHARDGRIDAALDACYAALSFDPDDVALHLAMVELYGLRGWDSLAADKLGLLERIARLDGDEGALTAVAAARARPA